MNGIIELRKDNDKTQKDIAKVLNISRQQYSCYKTEANQVSYEQLVILSKYYQVSIDYLLCNTDERKRNLA